VFCVAFAVVSVEIAYVVAGCKGVKVSEIGSLDCGRREDERGREGRPHLGIAH
jgi:hypothetical protein